MAVDEAVIGVFMVLAFCITASLAFTIQYANIDAGLYNYCYKLALTINATSHYLCENCTAIIYSPAPAFICNYTACGIFPVEVEGEAGGGCILIEKANGVVRVRSCGQ